MSRCPGKNSWPELLGKSGESAKATIERENSKVNAIVVPEGSAVTKDFRCNRLIRANTIHDISPLKKWPDIAQLSSMCSSQGWKLTQQILQEKKVRQGKAEMSTCPGKNSWPELLGKSGESAKATVESENSNVSAIVLLEGTPVTKDFLCDRVRIFVNQQGHVVQVPNIG
ncbi:Proteinase inhibitor I13, potato inhibitor I [Corchorus olitorius]|uniref:Proteinase inhibitor I13, potato inhibitor I n=1 Tax=Corchorus olitorius TaxID=93759 RepID=A0A1R3KQH1_9ROSI|nr:Proteinase inhibitor I13, potato inhibitor I [Corchorus olitorius]